MRSSGRMPQIYIDTINLLGGWDQITPRLSLKPGFAREALNYEAAIKGGYTRIKGFERFDGQAKPSDATYSTVYIDSFVNVPAIGNLLAGVDSSTTAEVVGVGADYVAYTKQTGNFLIPEVIKVGALVIGNSVAPTGSITALNNAIYTAAAADNYRADISAPPGSGGALGCVLYNDVLYTFKANAGGTAVDLYKSSAAGYVLVPYYNEVSFTAGTGIPVEGDTVTQGGVTAVLKRVTEENNDELWTGAAEGRLIIGTVTGGNFSAGAATVGSGTTLTISGAESAITFATGGRFEFELGNFTGSPLTDRVYGCDGINRAFEFDGDVLVPIYIGAPKHIEVHEDHLFLATGSALINSGTTLPYDFSAAAGAATIGVGHAITGMTSLPGNETAGALLVTSRKTTNILYGKNSTDFNFVKLDKGTGALDYTIMNMSDTYVFGERGVVSLRTSQAYGNFTSTSLTFAINNYIDSKVTKVISSVLDRRRSQYRVFFNDGSGLYITIVNGKVIGIMPIFFPVVVFMATEDSFSDGEEASYFCATDGFVYQIDKGTSFDGAAIDSLITLNLSTAKSPRRRKRYRKCALDVESDGYTSLNFGYSLGYGKSSIDQDDVAAYIVAIVAELWDEFIWDAFIWDGISAEPVEAEMRGTAENVALNFSSSSAYGASHTINTAMVHYTNRRQMR